MRDDRIGGYSNGPSGHFKSLGTNDTEWNITIGNRQKVVAQWNQTLLAFDQDIAPAMDDSVEAAIVRATVEHGLLLHTVVEAGWRAMALVRSPGRGVVMHSFRGREGASCQIDSQRRPILGLPQGAQHVLEVNFGECGHCVIRLECGRL